MNKLEGFYELMRIGLPSVPWKKYDSSVIFDPNLLWTIRSAVMFGDDLNLPRKVGVDADEAKEFAESLLKKLCEDDLILYYPFFVAEKSGVIEVARHRIVVEAVQADLWNLVTHNKRDVTVIAAENQLTYSGNRDFLSQEELSLLFDFAKRARHPFRDLLYEGKSIFLEWSFSYMSDIEKNPIGDKTLVFYEIRSV